MESRIRTWSTQASFVVALGIASATLGQVCELPTTGFLGNDMHHVTRAGSMIYALGGLGIIAIDASDPSNLEIVGEVSSPFANSRYAESMNNQADMAFDEGYLYIVGNDESATGLTGLLIYETTDPTAPSQIGYVEIPEGPRRIAVQGDLAFVTNWKQGSVNDPVGLHVIDISDRSNPTLLSIVEIFPEMDDLAVDGDYVYVATSGPSTVPTPMYVIDVSDPVNPTIAKEFTVIPGGPGLATGIAIDGDYAYLSIVYAAVNLPKGVATVDISDPENPVLVSAPILPFPVSVDAIHISNGYLFQSQEPLGIGVYDLSNPITPVYLGSFETGSNRHVNFTVDGGVLTVAYDGVETFDVSSPVAVNSLDRINPPMEIPTAVAVRGDVAFVFDGELGAPNMFKSIDISDPLNPIIMSSMETSGADFVLNGDYAIVGGLKMIDVSDPNNLEVVGSISAPGGHSVASLGDLALLVGSDGLVIASIEYPEMPFVVSTLPLPTNGIGTADGGVVMSGNFAYVGRRTSGLHVVDLSDPAQPFVAASIDTSAERVALCGDLLAVARLNNNVEFYDVSDPANPQFLSEIYANQARVWDLKIQGDLVYCSFGNDGLRIIDVSDPMNPEIVGLYHRWTDQVALNGTSTFVSIGNDGFHVVDTSNCGLPLNACPPPADPPQPPPLPPAGPADFNGDGFINGADLATLLASWGGPGGDLNGDGVTDGIDLATLLADWT